MFKNALVPVDLNTDSSWQRALPIAVNLVQSNNAKLHLMCVVPEYGSSMVSAYFPRNYEKSAIAETQKRLVQLAQQEIPATVEWQTHVGHGTIYKEILETATAHHCDLIVLASHRPELADYLLGPNAARVVRHATQSVMVVRD